MSDCVCAQRSGLLWPLLPPHWAALAHIYIRFTQVWNSRTPHKSIVRMWKAGVGVWLSLCRLQKTYSTAWNKTCDGPTPTCINHRQLYTTRIYVASDTLLSFPGPPPFLCADCWLTISHQGGFLTNGAKWSRATVAAGCESAPWGYHLALLLVLFISSMTRVVSRV